MEIPEASCKRVPSHYEVTGQRKGFKRYITTDIKSLLSELMEAEDKQVLALRDTMRRIFNKFDERWVPELLIFSCKIFAVVGREMLGLDFSGILSVGLFELLLLILRGVTPNQNGRWNKCGGFRWCSVVGLIVNFFLWTDNSWNSWLAVQGIIDMNRNGNSAIFFSHACNGKKKLKSCFPLL